MMISPGLKEGGPVCAAGGVLFDRVAFHTYRTDERLRNRHAILSIDVAVDVERLTVSFVMCWDLRNVPGVDSGGLDAFERMDFVDVFTAADFPDGRETLLDMFPAVTLSGDVKATISAVNDD